MNNALKHVFMVIIPTDYNTNQNNTSFQYTIGTISANTVNESLVSGNLGFLYFWSFGTISYPSKTNHKQQKKEKNGNITGTTKKVVQPNLKKIFKKIKLDRNFINTKVQYGRIFRKLIASYKHTTW